MHADVGRAAIEIDGRRGFGSGGGAAGERFGYGTTVDQLNPLPLFTSSIPIPRSPLASAFALWPSTTGQRANAVSKPISYTTRSAVRLLKRPGTITSEISLRSFFANDLRPTSLPNLTRRRAVGGTT